MYKYYAWIIGALIWGLISVIIILEHFRHGAGVYWQEFWFLCSLLWFQFGFAAVFNDMLKGCPHKINDRVFIAIGPPVALYIIVSTF